MKTILGLFLILSLSFPIAVSAQTGSFNETIMFNGENRTLSCFVPINYNPSQSYNLLIGLHGAGDNSSNYRNALINGLNWPSIMPNTIFIFPDGGSDQNKDFYAPLGDENIILECISYASQNFSIDQTEVILQGFSLGGRSALAFALDNPALFKGVMLHTAAIQGKLDGINSSNVGIHYNYSNATQVPIYSTVGEDDPLYFYNMERVSKLIKENNGMFHHISIASMGHQVPANSYVQNALAFFENQTPTPDDAELFYINTDKKYCEAAVQTIVSLRNTGANNLTSAELSYAINGNSNTFSWTGNLSPFESTEITLPSTTLANGNHSFSATVESVNNSNDTVLFMNEVSDDIIIHNEAFPLKYSEGFEQENLWSTNEDASVFEWFEDTDNAKSSTQSLGAFNTILLFNSFGNIESILSPIIDVSNRNEVTVTYDIAYAYHKYTPPYFQRDTVFADTLALLYSTDCGATFQSAYRAGGDDLATADPIVNPLSLPQCYLTASENDWRRDSIIIDVENADNLIIKFDYISSMGGSINIDNIEIDGDSISTSVNELHVENEIRVYPNPASEFIQIETTSTNSQEVTLLNSSGNVVLQQTVTSSTQNIPINEFPSGVYLLMVTSEKKSTYEKLVIQH